MAMCLYTYSNYLTPFFDDDESEYPLSLIKVFEPVHRADTDEFLNSLKEGKFWFHTEILALIRGRVYS